jgi:hypothetical protein
MIMDDEDQIDLNEDYDGEGDDDDDDDDEETVETPDFRGVLDLARALLLVEIYSNSRDTTPPEFASAFYTVAAFHSMEHLQLDITRPDLDVDNTASESTSRLESWETVGATCQEMTSLRTLSISFDGRPDWEALACILRHWRRPIKLEVENDNNINFRRDDVEHFGRAVSGHASIIAFETRDMFAVEHYDIIFSALSSLPALRAVTLWHQECEQEERNPVIPHPERFTELLLAPSLKVVEFDFFYFTDALCEAMASALSAGSNITSLRLNSCLFPEGSSSSIARALQENSTLNTLDCFESDVDADFFNALAKSLAVNTTLTELSVRLWNNDTSAWMTPVFHAMAVNVGVQKLVVDKFKLSETSVSDAIRYGMAHNSTLEKLIFFDVASVNAESVPWREALAFLPANTFLKALLITVGGMRLGQPLADLCMDAATLLQENTALQSLEIVSHGICPTDYFQTLSCLQGNVTLKALHLSCSLEFEENCCEEAAELVSAVQKNYGLTSLGGLIESRVPTLGTVLRLNKAGRSYLVQDVACATKGCALLSAVSDDLDCLYFHLLENPSLCERRE